MRGHRVAAVSLAAVLAGAVVGATAACSPADGTAAPAPATSAPVPAAGEDGSEPPEATHAGPPGGCDRPGTAATLLRSGPDGSLAPVPGLPPLVHATGGESAYLAMGPQGPPVQWSEEDPRPAAVALPVGAVPRQVAADSRTWAVRTADGRVLVWGDGGAGQAGDGGTAPLPAPVAVLAAAGEPLAGVTDLAVDGRTLAVVTDDGTVQVWGDGRHGQLGPGREPSPAATVTEVVLLDGSPLQGVVDVAVGGQHVVALMADGRVLTWGSNSHGQLGRPGVTEGSPVPSAVLLPPGVEAVVGVAANELDSYAVTADGRVLAWGNDESGQTGTGGTGGPGARVDVPTVVVGATDVVCVSAGEAFAAALTASGEVLTWGAGGGGQLAAGQERQRREAGPALDTSGAPVEGVVWVGAGARTLLVGRT